MSPLIESLNWRYATKQYDPSKKLSDEQVKTLFEAVRLTPTSYGLQMYHAYNIKNPEIRKQLRGAAWDQPQFTDASHLIVFTVPTNLDDTHVGTFIKKVAEVRGVPIESLEGYSSMIKGAIASKTPEQRTEWLARQAYIALGFLLETAAIEHVDATPMEGFSIVEFNRILGLDEKNETAVVCAALGFRADTDPYISMKKVRFSQEELVKEA